MQYTFNGVCKGTTKAGNRCRRIVVYANGLCKAHGGDSTEYMRELSERLKEKALRRHARFLRKAKRAKRTKETTQDMRSQESQGLPCQCKLLLKGGKCKFHGGMSTGPRTPEGKARTMAALHAGWLKWRSQKGASNEFDADIVPTISSVCPTT